MAEAEDKPWAEMTRRERAGMVVGMIVGAGFLLGIVAFIVAGSVISTHEAFAPGPPARVCAAGETRHCLASIPAHVRTATASSFVVSTDRPPYVRDIAAPDGPLPAAGTRITLEEWKGEVIAIVDPEHGRRHTADWPDRGEKVGTAIVFDLFLLGPVGLCLAGWFSERKERRQNAALAGVSERHAQTS